MTEESILVRHKEHTVVAVERTVGVAHMVAVEQLQRTVEE
jgi:hypothetical protein